MPGQPGESRASNPVAPRAGRRVSDARWSASQRARRVSSTGAAGSGSAGVSQGTDPGDLGAGGSGDDDAAMVVGAKATPASGRGGGGGGDGAAGGGGGVGIGSAFATGVGGAIRAAGRPPSGNCNGAIGRLRIGGSSAAGMTRRCSPPSPASGRVKDGAAPVRSSPCPSPAGSSGTGRDSCCTSTREGTACRGNTAAAASSRPAHRPSRRGVAAAPVVAAIAAAARASVPCSRSEARIAWPNSGSPSLIAVPSSAAQQSRTRRRPVSRAPPRTPAAPLRPAKTRRRTAPRS